MEAQISNGIKQAYADYASSVIVSKQVEVFNNPHFGEIRAAIDGNGEPLFCLTDVARALGYKNPAKAVIDHCKGVTVLETPTNGGIQPVKFGKEGEMYRLVLKSNAPKAEEFQSWVCDDVLPSLRKYGVYAMPKCDIGELTKARAFAAQFVKNELRLNDASYLGLLQQVANPLGLELPQYVPSQGVLKSASVLLKEIGADISVVKFNQLLEAQGYVETMSRPSANGKSRKFKNITDKGKAYGENEVNPKNQKETQPHWYADRFGELYRIVTA